MRSAVGVVGVAWLARQECLCRFMRTIPSRTESRLDRWETLNNVCMQFAHFEKLRESRATYLWGHFAFVPHAIRWRARAIAYAIRKQTTHFRWALTEKVVNWYPIIAAVVRFFVYTQLGRTCFLLILLQVFVLLFAPLFAVHTQFVDGHMFALINTTRID